MHTPSYDPGLTQQFAGPLSRTINQDGGFNVMRRGSTWRDVHPYLFLINLSWGRFFAVVFAAYVVVNTLFAVGYYAMGQGALHVTGGTTSWDLAADAFFFSSHTLTTVGYGSIAPQSMPANFLAAFESLVGVMGFAVATGLMYGRVSRPSARIGFSRNMAVAPYQEGLSLQFRVVNRRPNSLMELEAQILLMTVEPDETGEERRKYQQLLLERPKVLFFPLTWTVVHPIDESSPLRGKTKDDLQRIQAEVLILIKAYDDTFSQMVLARHSYRHDEWVWGKRFAPAFFVNPEGRLVLEIQKVSEFA